MKKNLLISAIVIAIVVATVAISFAAWDIFKATDNVTFNTGDNVALEVTKDTYTLEDKLVPKDAIKQNDKYKYEVVMAKGIRLSITTGEATTDTVEYVWDLTKVTVDTASDVIKDVESFKKYFVITMRPENGNADGSDDVALDGKLDINKKYDLVVKFAIDANAQEQKVDDNDANKKVWLNSTDGNEVSYTDAEYNALSQDEKDKLSEVKIDIFGDKFKVSDFKAKNIKLEITFEAVNKTEGSAA